MISVFTGFSPYKKITSLNDIVQSISYNTDTNTGGLVFEKCNCNDKTFDLFINNDKEIIKIKDVELLENKKEHEYISFAYKSLTRTRH